MSDKRYIPVRLSHLLRHCSVGAIVRGPDFLMTVRDTREWCDPTGNPAGQIVYYVEQVKSALGIQCDLREPPVAVEAERGIEGTAVPAEIFPAWMRCPTCSLLYFKPWRTNESKLSLRCWHCGRGRLEQVSWVLVHRDGHLADLPWHWLAHQHAINPDQERCKRQWDVQYLKLLPEAGRWKLQCEVCRASTRFDGHIRARFSGSQQPWLRTLPEASEEVAEVMEVNDARVHLPDVQNALVIPPESRVRKGSVVDRLYSSSEKRDRLFNAKTPRMKRSAIRSLCTELRCSEKEIEEAVDEINKGYPLYGRQMTPGLLLESEYQALSDPLPNLSDDEDFVPVHRTSAWREFVDALEPESRPWKVGQSVDQVVRLARLKEIMVFQGFRRGDRASPLVPPDIEGATDWLPALELYGEGIFITLDQAMLGGWEAQPAVLSRAEVVRRRFVAAGLNFEPGVTVTPRFMLLHVLSHMLIRELESQAGYPAASLKERIYSSNSSDATMAGILVYVAVPDVVGSLGGLAELAEPQRLHGLLMRVFDHADWCSLDPVCAEQEGHGPGLLNRAACHGCALIPETCCAFGNLLLDRTFLKGDAEQRLKSILEAAE